MKSIANSTISDLAAVGSGIKKHLYSLGSKITGQDELPIAPDAINNSLLQLKASAKALHGDTPLITTSKAVELDSIAFQLQNIVRVMDHEAKLINSPSSSIERRSESMAGLKKQMVNAINAVELLDTFSPDIKSKFKEVRLDSNSHIPTPNTTELAKLVNSVEDIKRQVILESSDVSLGNLPGYTDVLADSLDKALKTYETMTEGNVILDNELLPMRTALLEVEHIVNENIDHNISLMNTTATPEDNLITREHISQAKELAYSLPEESQNMMERIKEITPKNNERHMDMQERGLMM